MSRGTWVSDPESLIYFGYGTVTPYGQPFQTLRLYIRFITFRQNRNFVRSDPTTPCIQRFRALTYTGFGLFPFRSPLLWKSLLFSFPEVTKMFQFTSFASSAYLYSADDVIVLTMTGFPIQISPDQRLFGNSPKLIAACRVFHRLLTPRHPPFALNSLATKYFTKSC